MTVLVGAAAALVAGLLWTQAPNVVAWYEHRRALRQTEKYAATPAELDSSFAETETDVTIPPAPYDATAEAQPSLSHEPHTPQGSSA
jgi:hypothetical protein